MAVSGQLQAPVALTAGEKFPGPSGQKTGWFRGLVLTVWRAQKYFATASIGTTNTLSSLA